MSYEAGLIHNIRVNSFVVVGESCGELHAISGTILLNILIRQPFNAADFFANNLFYTMADQSMNLRYALHIMCFIEKYTHMIRPIFSINNQLQQKPSHLSPPPTSSTRGWLSYPELHARECLRSESNITSWWRYPCPIFVLLRVVRHGTYVRKTAVDGRS